MNDSEKWVNHWNVYNRHTLIYRHYSFIHQSVDFCDEKCVKCSKTLNEMKYNLFFHLRSFHRSGNKVWWPRKTAATTRHQVAPVRTTVCLVKSRTDSCPTILARNGRWYDYSHGLNRCDTRSQACNIILLRRRLTITAAGPRLSSATSRSRAPKSSVACEPVGDGYAPTARCGRAARRFQVPLENIITTFSVERLLDDFIFPPKSTTALVFRLPVIIRMWCARSSFTVCAIITA